MMTAPHRCVICDTPIRCERGEREELWRSRRACSLACRDRLRARTMQAKAATRLAQAVVAWSPGADVTRLAQHHGVRSELLRQELLDRGCDLTRPRRGRPGRPAGSKNKRQEPQRDFLLERLIEVYGPARPAAVADPAKKRAA